MENNARDTNRASQHTSSQSANAAAAQRSSSLQPSQQRQSPTADDTNISDEQQQQQGSYTSFLGQQQEEDQQQQQQHQRKRPLSSYNEMLRQQQQRIEQLQRMVNEEKRRNSVLMIAAATAAASTSSSKTKKKRASVMRSNETSSKNKNKNKNIDSTTIVDDDHDDDNDDGDIVSDERNSSNRPHSLFIVQDESFDDLKRYRRLLHDSSHVNNVYGMEEEEDRLHGRNTVRVKSSSINGVVHVPKLQLGSILHERDAEFVQEILHEEHHNADGLFNYLERGMLSNDPDDLDGNFDGPVSGHGDDGVDVGTAAEHRRERNRQIAKRKLRELQQRASQFLHHSHNVYQFNLFLSQTLKRMGAQQRHGLLVDDIAVQDLSPAADLSALARADVHAEHVEPLVKLGQRFANTVMPLIGFGDSRSTKLERQGNESFAGSSKLPSWIWSKWESLVIEPPCQLFMEVTKFDSWSSMSWMVESVCRTLMSMQLIVLLLSWCVSLPFIRSVSYSALDNAFNIDYTYSTYGAIGSTIIYYLNVVLWFGAPIAHPHYYHYGMTRHSASITVDSSSNTNIITLGPTLTSAEHNLLPPLFYVGFTVSMLLVMLTALLCTRSNVRTLGKASSASQKMVQNLLFHCTTTSISEETCTGNQSNGNVSTSLHGLRRLSKREHAQNQDSKQMSSLMLALLIHCLPALYIPSITGLLSGIVRLSFQNGIAQPAYWIYAVLSAIMLVALIGLTLYYAVSFYEWRPPGTPGCGRRNMMARSHSRVDIAVILMGTLLVLLQQIIGLGLHSSQNAQEFTVNNTVYIIKSGLAYMYQDYTLATTHLFIAIAAAMICIYYSPFYKMVMNRIMTVLSISWICITVTVLLVTIFNRGSQILSLDASDPSSAIHHLVFDLTAHNDLSDVPLLAFLACAVISIALGVALSLLRLNVLRRSMRVKTLIKKQKAFYFDGVNIVEVSDQVGKNIHGDQSYSDAEDAQRHLPLYQKSFWSAVDMDIASRFMVSDIDKIAYCNRIYEINSPHFTDNPFFHLSWATFMGSHLQHPLRALEILSLTDHMFMPIDMRIATRIRRNYWRQHLVMFNSDDSRTMCLDRALFYENETRILQLTLWHSLDQLVSKHSISSATKQHSVSLLASVMIVSNIVDAMCFAEKEANRFFKDVIRRFPSADVFRQYARFLRDVANDPTNADKKISYATLLEYGETIEELHDTHAFETVDYMSEDRERYLKMMANILERNDNKPLDAVDENSRASIKEDGVDDSDDSETDEYAADTQSIRKHRDQIVFQDASHSVMHRVIDFTTIHNDNAKDGNILDNRNELQGLGESLHAAVPPSEFETERMRYSLERLVEQNGDDSDDDICSLDDRPGYSMYDRSEDLSDYVMEQPSNLPYENDMMAGTKRSIMLLAKQQRQQHQPQQQHYQDNEPDPNILPTEHFIRRWIDEKFDTSSASPSSTFRLTFLLIAFTGIGIICSAVSTILLILDMVIYANDPPASGVAIARESIIGVLLLFVVPLTIACTGYLIFTSIRTSVLGMVERRLLALSMFFNTLHMLRTESSATSKKTAKIARNIYLQMLSKQTLKEDNHRQRAARFLSMATTVANLTFPISHHGQHLEQSDHTSLLFEMGEYDRPGAHLRVRARDKLYIAAQIIRFLFPLILHGSLSFLVFASLYIVHLVLFASTESATATATDRVMTMLSTAAMWTLISLPVLLYIYFQRLEALVEDIDKADYHSKRIVLSIPLKCFEQNRMLRDMLSGSSVASNRRVPEEASDVIQSDSLACNAQKREDPEPCQTAFKQPTECSVFDPAMPAHLVQVISNANVIMPWSKTLHVVSVVIIDVQIPAKSLEEDAEISVTLLHQVQQVIDRLLSQYKMFRVAKQGSRFVCTSSVENAGSESIIQTRSVLEFCLAVAQKCSILSSRVGVHLTLCIGIDTAPCVLVVERDEPLSGRSSSQRHAYHRMDLLGDALEGAETMVQMTRHSATRHLRSAAVKNAGKCTIHVTKNCFVRVHDRFAFKKITHNSSAGTNLPSSSYLLISGQTVESNDRTDANTSLPAFHHVTPPPVLRQAQRTVDLRRFASSSKIISPDSRRIMRRESSLLLSKRFGSTLHREPGVSSPASPSLTAGHREHRRLRDKSMSIYDAGKGASLHLNDVRGYNTGSTSDNDNDHDDSNEDDHADVSFMIQRLHFSPNAQHGISQQHRHVEHDIHFVESNNDSDDNTAEILSATVPGSSHRLLI